MQFPWQRKRIGTKKRAVRRGARPASSKKMLIWQLVFGFLLLLLFAGLAAATWYLTRLPAVTISSVTVVAGETVSAQVVEDVVEAELEGAYMSLVPKRFTYLYPKDSIESAVGDVPRVKEVLLDKANRNALTVSFTEYVPHALSCTSAASTSDCTFMDETGFGFAKAPQLSGGTFVRYIDQNADPELKTLHVNSDFLRSSETFAGLLKEKTGWVVGQVEITTDTDVVYRLGTGAEILTSPEISPADSLANLLSVLQAPEFASLAGADFEYVDLRFGNKVYVLEELPGVASSTATSTEITSLD